MLQANFYQLQTAPIKSAFPKLLENLFTKEKTVQIVCTNDAEVEYYDMLIWTYSQLSFIPHSTYKDKYIKEQSAYITLDVNDNPLMSRFTFFFDFDMEINDSVLQNIQDRERIMWMCENSVTLAEKASAIQNKLMASGINTVLIQEKNGSWKSS